VLEGVSISFDNLNINSWNSNGDETRYDRTSHVIWQFLLCGELAGDKRESLLFILISKLVLKVDQKHNAGCAVNDTIYENHL
jgi:hypothetical protein